MKCHRQFHHFSSKMSDNHGEIIVESCEVSNHLSELAQELVAQEVELIVREFERKYECISRDLEQNHGFEVKNYIEELKQKYMSTHTALVQELMSQEVERISKESKNKYEQAYTFEERGESQGTGIDEEQKGRSSSSSLLSQISCHTTERKLDFLYLDGMVQSYVEDNDGFPKTNTSFSKRNVQNVVVEQEDFVVSDHIETKTVEVEGEIIPHELATQEILVAFNVLEKRIESMLNSTESDMEKKFSMAWQDCEKRIKYLEDIFDDRVEEIKMKPGRSSSPLHTLEEGQSTSSLSSSDLNEDSENQRHLDVLTGFGNSQYCEEVQDDKILYLDEDTYTMMMISSVNFSLTKCICFCFMPCILMQKGSWVFGLIPPLIQLILCSIIVSDQTNLDVFVWLENSKFPGSLNIPAEQQSNAVYIGQFFAITLALMTQSDVLSATHTFLLLRYSSQVPWQRTLSRNGKEEIIGGYFTWMTRVFIPVSLKFIQGMFVLFISWLLIVQSTNVVDLLKDYTALFVISSIDDIFYLVAANGYLGTQLASTTEEAKGVQIYTNDNDRTKMCSIAKIILFFFILFGMLGGWIGTMVGQIQGKTGNNFVYEAS